MTRHRFRLVVESEIVEGTAVEIMTALDSRFDDKSDTEPRLQTIYWIKGRLGDRAEEQHLRVCLRDLETYNNPSSAEDVLLALASALRGATAQILGIRLEVGTP